MIPKIKKILYIIKRCLNDLDIDELKFIPNVVLSLISKAKDYLISPLDYRIDAEKRGEEFFIKIGIYENYQKILEESQNLDFGDLLYKVVEMFEIILLFWKNIKRDFVILW